MSEVIAVANQKGGVGKTSTTVNLGAALVRAERSVLLVDLDPQASLTEYFLKPEEMLALTDTTFTMLIEGKRIAPVLLGDKIALLPTMIDLAAAEVQLPAKRGSEKALARLIRQYDQDYVLIDCPPSLGILTTNALAAAHRVIVPCETEIMAERTIKLIMATIDDVRGQSEINPTLSVWRVLATMYDARLLHHREILEALRAKYGDLLYPTPVKATTKYKDSVTGRTDVSELDDVQGQFWDTMAATLLKEVER